MHRLILRRCSMMLLLASVWSVQPRSVYGQDEDALPTPETVWKGFDPEAGPLEEEIIKQWSDDGVDLKEVHFNAYVNGETVRVYGIYAAPRHAEKLPALMHLHGGGQTVGRHWIKTWTRRGYAFLTINCHGEWPNRKRVTRYPPALKQGNHREAGALRRATEPSLRVSSWYIWAAINRRALTYLARQKEVDAERLGIFGISMGGTTVWHVAMDARVKAACAIYGVGWNDHALYDEKFNTAKHRPAPSLHQRKWNSGMAPQAYPPCIRCPVLFLDGSNDNHGNLDYAFDTMQQMRDDVPWRVAITPHFRHHIGKAESENLILWMNTWLRNGPAWPKTPTATLTLDKHGDPLLKLAVDASQAIQRIAVYYNIGQPDNKSRYWHEVDPIRTGAEWNARLPTIDTKLNLVAFANVYYENGVCLTSPLVAGIPARLGAARASEKPSLRVYDGSMGVRGWTTRSPGTDPNPPVPVPIRLKQGPDGKRGIAPETKYRRLMTYKIGDPRWRGPDGARLRFKVFSKSRQQIAIKLADRVVSHRAREVSAVVTLEGGAEWQTITLAAEQCVCEKDQTPLASWKDLVVLSIVPAQGKAFTDPDWIVTDMEWVVDDANGTVR